MLVLIAESKTMAEERMVTAEDYRCHMPLFEEKAGELMAGLDGLTVAELATEIGVSGSLAKSMFEMVRDFPNKNMGRPALSAFTGVVFKALDTATLTWDALVRADRNLRIISSLYGILRPSDIIKRYRLEFKSKIAPNHKSLAEYWKKDVTIAIGRYLQENGITEILDLMPSDAAKCIDFKLIKRFAKVVKVEFLEQSGDELRTPNAGKLKKLRGELLRTILIAGYDKVSDLAELEGENFIYCDKARFSGNICFMTD